MSYTILLVDQDPERVGAFERPLAQAGYKVLITTDNLEALEAFQRVQPDLVMIEVILPDKHGFELCQVLKETPQGKATPIVITSEMQLGESYRAKALHEYGCDEFIETPISDEQLVAHCLRLLQSRPTKAEQDTGATASSEPAAVARGSAAAHLQDISDENLLDQTMVAQALERFDSLVDDVGTEDAAGGAELRAATPLNRPATGDALRESLEELAAASDELVDRLPIGEPPTVEAGLSGPALASLQESLDELARVVGDLDPSTKARVEVDVEGDRGEDIQGHLDTLFAGTTPPVKRAPTAAARPPAVAAQHGPMKTPAVAKPAPQPVPRAVVERRPETDVADEEVLVAVSVEQARGEEPQEAKPAGKPPERQAAVVPPVPRTPPAPPATRVPPTVAIRPVGQAQTKKGPPPVASVTPARKVAAPRPKPASPRLDAFPEFSALPPDRGQGTRWVIGTCIALVLVSAAAFQLRPQRSPQPSGMELASAGNEAPATPTPVQTETPVAQDPPPAMAVPEGQAAPIQEQPATGAPAATASSLQTPSRTEPGSPPKTVAPDLSASPRVAKPGSQPRQGPEPPSPTTGRAGLPAPPRQKEPAASSSKTATPAGAQPAQPLSVRTPIDAERQPAPNRPAASRTAEPVRPPVTTPARPAPTPIGSPAKLPGDEPRFAGVAPPAESKAQAPAPVVQQPAERQAAAPGPVAPSPLPPPPPTEIIERPRFTSGQELSRQPATEPPKTLPRPPASGAPVAIRRVEASYPPRALKRGESGTVTLKVLISETGKVVRVVVEQGIPGSELEAAAIDAVLRWEYRPATENGNAVRAWTRESFVFKP